VITANDIVEYMKVVQKSIEQFSPELTQRSLHLTHGNLKLEGGRKMSSRKGNFLLALDILEAATQASKELTGQDNRQTMLGAVKYAFLKQRIGGDIVYSPKESVSLEGNSGPYLQYAHARACSILAKAHDQPVVIPDSLEPGERSLVRKIAEYPEVFEHAAREYMPHHICTYLYELAQSFNRFYEHNRVIGDNRQAQRLALVGMYAAVLKDGLSVLGIDAPEQL
jgi:arginyl-tRNA synthetase